MRIRPSSRTVWISGCTVLIYAVLVLVSASCGIVHAQLDGDAHHHHEKGSSAQGAFCAWACQLTSEAAVAAEPPDAEICLVAETVMPTADLPGASFKRLGFPSRAPPRMPSVLS